MDEEDVSKYIFYMVEFKKASGKTTPIIRKKKKAFRRRIFTIRVVYLQ